MSRVYRLLACAVAAHALKPPLRIEVLTCDACESADFDPVAAFETLARTPEGFWRREEASIATAACDDCAGPSARVLVDGEAALFGAGAMSESERRRKSFDGLATAEDAARVWDAATGLVDRLALLGDDAAAAAAPPAAAEKPGSSAAFYGEAELRDLLQMHEALDLDLDLDADADADAGPADVLGLHDLVRSMVEEADGDG